ncbi:MAG: hypothetical protein JNJ57_11730 [Saprospiraceae bacterium]|nr:hypothetical protein [Saprospiraceae bacterium]
MRIVTKIYLLSECHKKILLIGTGGAGKSTLANSLASHLRIPLIHLDALFRRPGWVQTPAAEVERF